MHTATYWKIKANKTPDRYRHSIKQLLDIGLYLVMKTSDAFKSCSVVTQVLRYQHLQQHLKYLSSNLGNSHDETISHAV